MIGIEVLVAEVSGVGRQDVERWIGFGWVRPDGAPGQYVFHEVDVARVRLIQNLHVEMEVNEDTLPLVLSLLDQVYDLRRRMRQIGAALDQGATEDARQSLIRHLAADRLA